MRLADRIVVDPDTCSGHPRIEGTRVRVSNVLGWLAAGMSAADIAAEYPYLSEDDVRAALEFAARTVDAAPIAAARSILFSSFGRFPDAAPAKAGVRSGTQWLTLAALGPGSAIARILRCARSWPGSVGP